MISRQQGEAASDTPERVIFMSKHSHDLKLSMVVDEQ
nr:MAG TPA: hypothetical protein [Caudoviricetes sp.]